MLNLTLISSGRWMHYSIEGGSPGLQSLLLHILSWIIKSSQGGLRYGPQYVSNTHTNWKHMASCKHRPGNVWFCPLFDPSILFHTPSGAAGQLCFCCENNAWFIHEQHVTKYENMFDDIAAGKYFIVWVLCIKVFMCLSFPHPLWSRLQQQDKGKVYFVKRPERGKIKEIKKAGKILKKEA